MIQLQFQLRDGVENSVPGSIRSTCGETMPSLSYVHRHRHHTQLIHIQLRRRHRTQQINLQLIIQVTFQQALQVNIQAASHHPNLAPVSHICMRHKINYSTSLTSHAGDLYYHSVLSVLLCLYTCSV
eukprot:scpid103449/ scgid6152/ 